MVINKPAGISVQQDSSGDDSIIELIKSYLVEKYNKPGDAYLGLVHRLDRPVSGLLILAKTSKAMTRLSEQMRNKSIDKRYVAISHKSTAAQNGIITNYLLKDGNKNKVQSHNHPIEGAKESRTKYALIGNQNGLFAYQLNPVTGRSHQLRVHLASLGSPIMGDVKYGGQKHSDPRSLLLHSYYIGFLHPVKKERMEFTHCPTSKVWTSLPLFKRVKIFIADFRIGDANTKLE